MGASVLAILLGILPMWKTTWQKVTTMNELTKEIEKLRTKSQELEALNKDKILSDYEYVITAVPNEQSVSTFMTTVDTLATEKNVTLRSFTIDTIGISASASAQKKTSEEQSLGASIVSANVSLDGSLEDIRDFLVTVGSIRRLLRIKQFNISFGKQSSMTCQIQLEAFFLPLPATIGKPSDPLPKYSEDQKNALTRLSGFPLVSVVQEPVTGSINVETGRTDLFIP